MEDIKLSGRIKSVDALRALAVLPVIIFHLNHRWLPGGYIGVDIFFVISGFLITGIILREIEARTFSFAAFYTRRIRRILPALFVMMTCVALVFAWTAPLHLNELFKQIGAVIALVGNIAARDLAGNYWGSAAQEQPLLHTWSLGVEEQFYLGFPIMLWLLCRSVLRPKAMGVLLVVAFFSFLWHIAQSIIAPHNAFYLLGGRAWELLVGAIMALACRGPVSRKAVPEWVSWTGLALIVAAYVLPPDNGARFFAPPFAVAGAAMFLSAASTSSSAHTWLSRPWMVYVGLISYSLYLWHWPAIVLFKQSIPAGMGLSAGLLALVAGIFLVSVLSYHLIEKPMRSARLTVWGVFMSIPLLLLGGFLLVRANGRPALVASADPRATSADTWVGGFRGMTVQGLLYSSNPRTVEPGDKYLAVKFVRHPPSNGIESVPTGGEPEATHKVVVWGDSHGVMLAPVADAAIRSTHYAAVYHLLDGGDPAVWRARRVGTRPVNQWLRRYFRDDKIATSDELDQFEALGLRLLRDRPAACLFVLRYDERPFEALEASFREILRHTRLIVVQQPPRLDIPDLCTVDYFAFLRDKNGISLSGLIVQELPSARQARAQFEAQLLAHFGHNKNFIFVPTADLFTKPDGSVRWWDGVDQLYYIDDDHLSEFGAQLLAPRIEAALRPSLTQ